MNIQIILEKGMPKLPTFKRKFENAQNARVFFPTKLGHDSTRNEMIIRTWTKPRNLVDANGERYEYSKGKERIVKEDYGYKQFEWKREKSINEALLSKSEVDARSEKAKVVRYKRNGVVMLKIEM